MNHRGISAVNLKALSTDFMSKGRMLGKNKVYRSQ